MSEEQIIVQVGADGSDLKLYGKNGNGWSFTIDVCECTPVELGKDEGGGTPAQHISLPLASWADAVAALNRYPWAKLRPLAVHPDFREKVWDEIQKQLNSNGDDHDNFHRWRKICGIESNWLDSYYEALEFVYWEPQHIGRKKYADAKLNTITKVVEHLRTMEVTLNHNLKQLFMLAPVMLRNGLFGKIFGQPFATPFRLCGPAIDVEFPIEGCMQPDFLFTAEGEVVSIEMKVEAKCSVDQVLKYALLGLAVELEEQTPKKHYLILLGKGPFSSLFNPRFDSITHLTEAVRTCDLSSFLKDKPHRLGERQERLSKIINEMEVTFITYADLARMFADAAPLQTDQSSGAEVYRNLVFGLVAEFRRRQLM